MELIKKFHNSFDPRFFHYSDQLQSFQNVSHTPPSKLILLRSFLKRIRSFRLIFRKFYYKRCPNINGSNCTYSIRKVFPFYADQLPWEHNLKRNFIWNFVRDSLLQRRRQVLNVIWNTVEPTGLKLTLLHCSCKII